ncbi:hypothetical protein DSM106972_053430 [Dulcicalothrix desertica PCC 7102]|uniref:Uncharacterized protein n=1 Tax=Dulcicalothrix desertica PCC 7102 TaxID=232991 RepID=A0A3S1CGG4_9CYAN|nr:N-formylglutamate amidohydrolase [Dulcicalothrix desertica]RUT03035.1 hypothetical protein DSM106972_053430 [Dulcicalothrix desertica PCC 7102]TWH53408.1 putative N-formylglutamate amidohydrolase [Dulcicalothrix desertica PCC 7102]
MSKILPIVYSAHHASHNFGKFTSRCALTLEQCVKYSDYGTDDTVPKHTHYSISNYSRGLVDLNRAPDSPTLFPKQDFGKPNKNNIWLSGFEPTDEERKFIRETIYEPYHQQLLQTIKNLEDYDTESNKPIVVVAWDNTAHYEIGKNPDGTARIMDYFILCNNGDRNKGNSTNPQVKTTCNPDFIVELANNLNSALREQKLEGKATLNTYDDKPNNECGYIASNYNTHYNPGISKKRPVESFQVEYSTIITHSQQHLCPNYEAMQKLRLAFEKAMEETYTKFFR